MKTFLAVVAVSVLGSVGSLVIAQNRAPMPPGVSELEWIPISESFGFVVTMQASGRDPDTLTGYFVARQGNMWKKVDSEGGFRFQPLQK